jgi:predicted O-methyltransferase YrrM
MFLNVPVRIARLKNLRSERRSGDGDGATNHIDGLIMLIDKFRPKSVLEIGAFTGVSTEVFALLCDKVTTIDPLPGDLHRCFWDRMWEYSNVSLHRNYSENILPHQPHAHYDMCYIDGDHGYDAVLHDIEGCRPLVKLNGVIAGHDYGGDIPEVTAAVTDALGVPPYIFSDGSWAVEKIDL